MISKKFIAEYLAFNNGNDRNNADIDQTTESVAAMLDAYIESSNMAILAVDTHRKIVAANSLAARILRTTETSMIDRFVFNVIPAESPLTKEDLANAVNYPATVVVNGRTLIAERALLNAGDTFIGVISYFQDNTDDSDTLLNPSEKLRQAALNPSFYEDVIDSSYDGLFITDSKGKTVFVNEAYERMSGLSKSELIGEYVQNLTQEGKLSTSLTDEVVQTKEVVTRNQTLPNGMEVLITGTPCFDAKGGVRHVITNVRDISELVSLSSKISENEQRLQLLQSRLFKESSDDNIVCASIAFSNVLNMATKLAKMDSSVLLLGETGTGKEIISQHIHKSSPRAKKPYIKINCGSIPENLLESELFGYVPGAFTGASSKGKPGMFEMADTGTLFLDEIGELPLNLQSSLLRVLQDGEVTRVGGIKSKKVDVRIIAATNRKLEEMIAEGTFRADLYYRLNVVSINIPPLRERIDDIQPLAEKALDELREKYGIKKVLSPNFIEYLKKQPWPGNIRELRNYIERQFVLTEGSIINSPAPSFSDELRAQPDVKVNYVSDEAELPTYAQAKDKMERELFSRAMAMGGSTYKAAELLDMSQSTFFRKYKDLFPDNK